MEQIINTGLEHREIEQMLYGSIKSRLLLCSIDLKIFDLLDEPMEANLIAGRLNTHPGNTRLLLNALVACNLLRYENGRYKNTERSNMFLNSQSPACIAGWIAQSAQMFEPVLDDFANLVKTGPAETRPDDHMNSEAMCEFYTHAHAQTELAGVAQKTAGIIRELPEFKGFKTMLDLGGGPGLNSVAVAQANALLESVVFDRKPVTAIAESYIQRFGMTDRIKVLAGDYFKDDLGRGYDIILASDTLYYEGEDLNNITARIYDALNPGGVLVGIHGVLTKDRTGPSHMVLGMLPDALMDQGELPCEGFLAPALFKAGFRHVHTKKTLMVSNEMEVDIARK